MAIGTTAAIIGSAVIGAGASMLGGAKNSKAIGKAADAQAAATREATALQRDVYNRNVGFQTPFLNTGMAAMGQMNALLGLNVPQAAPVSGGPVGGGVGGSSGGITDDAWAQNALSAVMPFVGPLRTRAVNGMTDPSDKLNYLVNYGFHNDEQQAFDAFQAGSPMPTGVQTNPSLGGVPANPADAQASANSAYDQFKGFTGYQTRLNEANNALNGAYAARGTLQSGAAMEAMAKMNQDYASNEFQNYMGYLGGQQQLGPGAANALSGVGTNYANAAGNLAIQNGQNIANAAIAKANNSNAMWGGVAGAFGNALGQLGGR